MESIPDYSIRDWRWTVSKQPGQVVSVHMYIQYTWHLQPLRRDLHIPRPVSVLPILDDAGTLAHGQVRDRVDEFIVRRRGGAGTKRKKKEEKD
jgi:hypothetical protein